MALLVPPPPAVPADDAWWMRLRVAGFKRYAVGSATTSTAAAWSGTDGYLHTPAGCGADKLAGTAADRRVDVPENVSSSSTWLHKLLPPSGHATRRVVATSAVRTAVLCCRGGAAVGPALSRAWVPPMARVVRWCSLRRCAERGVVPVKDRRERRGYCLATAAAAPDTCTATAAAAAAAPAANGQ